MPGIKNLHKPKGKGINYLLFLLSIIMIVAMWPQGAADNWLRISGRIIIISSCYLILYLFLAHFCSEVLKVTVKTLFILFLILSFIGLTKAVLLYVGEPYLFLIPFALIPVIIRTFYDSRLALFILVMTILLTAFFVPEPFEFGFITFISGMAAIFTLSAANRKAKFLFTALTVTFTSFIVFTASELMHEGNFNNVLPSDYLMFIGNGFLVLLSYPLIFLFENRFKFLSDITLLELADINHPVLRKLAEEAPGTFQHSLQVANLAEEAARITGASLLLVRTGALYHDIGKISGPDYYIENQKNGASPHDKLNPEDSARLIMNHVQNGIVLARNFKVPVQIIDFISTHHGTTVAYYFYKKFTEMQPWDTSRAEDFTYPGPKPFSKETAIVMMADAVEASSRSLISPTEENISELVERIILLQEQDGQYSDVPFTYRDISEVKAAFKKRLSTMYHGRIAYPER